MTFILSFRQIAVAGAVSALLLFSPLAITSSHAQDFCSALMSAHPEGGSGLEAEVQKLVAAAPEVAADVAGCAATANEEQAKALGTGLAKVAESLKESNPELSDQITALVTGSDNENMKTAFTDKQKDIATAALGDNGGDTPADGADEPADGDTPAVFSGGPPTPTLSVGTSGGGGTGGGSVSPN